MVERYHIRDRRVETRLRIDGVADVCSCIECAGWAGSVERRAERKEGDVRRVGKRRKRMVRSRLCDCQPGSAYRVTQDCR